MRNTRKKDRRHPFSKNNAPKNLGKEEKSSRDEKQIICFCSCRKPTYSFDIGPDLYGILGISRVASVAAIKKAYLLKAKEFHPDRNIGNKEIEEKFKLINQAYAILSDPEQRQLFDEYGYEQVKFK